MIKHKEISNVAYNNFNFNKSNINDEELDEFSEDTLIRF